MAFTRFTIEQSDQEFYTSQSGMALVGLAINRYTTLVSRVTKAAPCRGIATADVLRSYLGLLCQGKSDFAALRGRRILSGRLGAGEDSFARNAAPAA